jgi:acyl-CoA thioesterase FadM
VVQFSQIDLMHYLSKAAAVDMLDDADWEALSARDITASKARLAIRRHDIDYVNSPRFGDRLEIESWFEPMPEEGQEFTRFQRITARAKP